MKIGNTAKTILIAGMIFVLGSSFVYEEDALDKVLNAMARYRQLYPQEKIFLHRDKPYYLSGETIFFKAYLLDANEGKLKGERNLIYVNLSGKQGSIQTVKVLAKDGLAQGNIDLPDSLQNGIYRLTAYTNLMRNLDEKLFFQAEIKIYKIKSPGAIYPEQKEDLNVSFHPEGGTLVQGQASKVGIRARDESGNGIETAGKIVSSENEEITSFSTDQAGVGVFFLLPKKGVRYKAVSPEGEWKLPVAKNEGAVLQVIPQADHFKVTVATSFPGSEEFLLISQSRGHVQFYAKGTNQTFITNLPKEKLSAGLNQFVLFNKKGEVLSQRLVFVEGGNHPVQLEMNANEFQAREEVLATLSLPGEAKDTAFLSVSVAKRKSDREFSAEEIYLLNEFQGDFSQNQGIIDSSLNDYLLTEKWARYDWKQIFDTLSMPDYRQEGTLFIRGWLTDPNNTPIANELVSVTFPNNPLSYEAVSDPTGYLQIPVLEYTGSEYIIIQPLKNENLFNKLRLKKDNAYTKATSSPFPEHRNDGSLSQEVKEQVENHLITDAYNLQDVIENPSEIKAANEDKSQALRKLYTNEVILEDYISFPNMREVFREIVTGVFVQEGKDEIKVSSDDPQTVFKSNPLIIVDGVPTYDAKAVLALDPEDVLSIGVIRHPRNLFNFSKAGKDGVLVIITRLNTSAHTFKDPNVFQHEGLVTLKSYASINHSTIRIPDFRPVLYWNPMIKLAPGKNAEIAFKTSDEAGEFEIIIQGITKEGKPVFLKEVITNMPLR